MSHSSNLAFELSLDDPSPLVEQLVPLDFVDIRYSFGSSSFLFKNLVALDNDILALLYEVEVGSVLQRLVPQEKGVPVDILDDAFALLVLALLAVDQHHVFDLDGVS